MGDHTEAISIDYDPEVISYEQLLSYFWKGHRCERNNSKPQYMNAVFYRNEQQQQLAKASMMAIAKERGITTAEVATKIIPVTTFTYAENYHQKYYLNRQADIREFLSKNYPDSKSFADSTVATRLNAYLGSGFELDWKQFNKELPGYGLPDHIELQLKQHSAKSH